MPDPLALTHSARLAELIGSRIDDAGGAIPFFDYMDLCLYAPGLGYYAAGAQKFGAGGDFVTAPDLGPLFARTLASAIAPLLRGFDRPSILELGGGSGALAVDLLAALDELGLAPAYALLEVSAELRQRQQARAAERGLAGRIRWLDGPPTDPWQGLLLANEVVDALAVECFEIDDDGQPRRLGVSRKGEGFDWAPLAWTTPQRELLAACLPSDPRPAGYRSEFRPQLQPWIQALTAKLDRGLALFVDYGYPGREYYSVERSRGTLACHHRHQIDAEPFLLPGLKDLTASVDFTALARAGRACGLDLRCYTTQARWLVQAGLPQQLALQVEREPGQALALSAAARRLLLPQGMGERFQVMALARGALPALPAFDAPDLRHRL